MNNKILLLSILCLNSFFSFAGNPDRQGEAGAYELLLNPWARTAGLHAMNTSLVRGAEAMSLNVAGLSRINKTEIGVAHSIYLQGTGLGINGFGLAQRLSESGVLGVSINALSFGNIPVTTDNLPEGTGASFSPLFFNLAVSYAHSFEKKVSVGATVRFINESLADISASGISIDAGVQYFAGGTDYPERYKIGISLRNIGSPMRFGGQGLNQPSVIKDGVVLNLSKNAAQFELPSQLNIGMAYDILPTTNMRLTAVGNFTSNAFSRDELGGGLEFGYGNYFMIRGGYKYEVGTTSADVNKSVFTGVCGGISVELPFNKTGDQKLSIDYAYLATRTFNGSHNLSLRLNL